MKQKIREQIAVGARERDQALFVDQLGPGVLAVPPKRGFDLLAWLLPLAGLAVGAVVVGLLAMALEPRRPGSRRRHSTRSSSSGSTRRLAGFHG